MNSLLKAAFFTLLSLTAFGTAKAQQGSGEVCDGTGWCGHAQEVSANPAFRHFTDGAPGSKAVTAIFGYKSHKNKDVKESKASWDAARAKTAAGKKALEKEAKAHEAAENNKNDGMLILGTERGDVQQQLLPPAISMPFKP